jgi:hypothetical protein
VYYCHLLIVKQRQQNEFVIDEFEMQPPSKQAEVMILLTYIPKVLVSNLDWHTDYPEVLVAFSVLPGK